LQTRARAGDAQFSVSSVSAYILFSGNVVSGGGVTIGDGLGLLVESSLPSLMERAARYRTFVRWLYNAFVVIRILRRWRDIPARMALTNVLLYP